MAKKYSDYFTFYEKRGANAGTAMGWHDAVSFFEEIKANKDLRPELTEDGCADKTLLIQELLENQTQTHGNYLIEFEGNKHDWTHHFAPYVVIDTGQKVFFDTAISDQVLTEENWIKKCVKQGGIEKSVLHTPSFVSRTASIHDQLERLHSYGKNEQGTEHLETA